MRVVGGLLAVEGVVETRGEVAGCRPKLSLASWLGNGRYEVATGHLMARAGGLSTIDSYMLR